MYFTYFTNLNPELREIYLEDSRIEAALERILNQYSNFIDIGCHIGNFFIKDF